MYKELQDVSFTTHQSNLAYVKSVESISQVNIALNTMMSILQDFANKSELKTTKKKMEKIEKAQKTLQKTHDEVISKVKHKKDSIKKSEKTNTTYIG